MKGGRYNFPVLGDLRMVSKDRTRRMPTARSTLTRKGTVVNIDTMRRFRKGGDAGPVKADAAGGWGCALPTLGTSAREGRGVRASAAGQMRGKRGGRRGTQGAQGKGLRQQPKPCHGGRGE